MKWKKQSWNSPETANNIRKTVCLSIVRERRMMLIKAQHKGGTAAWIRLWKRPKEVLHTNTWSSWMLPSWLHSWPGEERSTNSDTAPQRAKGHKPMTGRSSCRDLTLMTPQRADPPISSQTLMKFLVGRLHHHHHHHQETCEVWRSFRSFFLLTQITQRTLTLAPSFCDFITV